MVRINTNGRHLWALIDSGADFSLMKEGVAVGTLNPSTRSRPAGTAVGAGGEVLNILGTEVLDFSIRDKVFCCRMAVVRGLIYDVILGRDFCCQNGTILDDKQGILYVGDMALPLPTYDEIRPLRSRATTSTVVIVPPRSEQIVWAKLEPIDGHLLHHPTSPIAGVLEPAKMKTDTGDLVISRAVARVDDDLMVPVRMANIGATEIRMVEGEELGTVFTLRGDGEGIYQVCEDDDPADDETQDDVGRDPELAVDLDGNDFSAEGERKLRLLVGEYDSIFSRGPNDIGRTHLVEHHIDTGDAEPVKQRPRRVPWRLRDQVESQKEQMLKDGVIEESNSPWCSPIVMAKKKDGTFRFCVDLRALNKVTKGFSHPLPTVQDSLDSLAGAKFFSTLDMASGYWQVGLDESAKEKTAFTTGRGLHQFTVMPFGCKNAGPTYQKLMELVISGMDAKSCLVYLDDVILFNQTEEDHLRDLAEVFARIKKAGMKLKPSKCSLARKEVRFLGHLVSRDGVRPDPHNTQKVSLWPRPEAAEDLRSFLGLCGYYSRFIPNYAEVTKPLRETLDRPGVLEWTERMVEAFAALKSKLTSSPVLALPSFRGVFRLATDACQSSVGSVLSEVVGGEEKVVAYASKVLSKSERRWPTYDKELWAVVWSIRHFRQYLVGSSFEVVTDHKPLSNLPQSVAVEKDATGRRGRWAIELSSYEFVVSHKKGSDHTNADALSRRPNNDSGEEVEARTVEDHEGHRSITVTTDGWFEKRDLKSEQELDPVLSVVRRWVQDSSPPNKEEARKLSWELRLLARSFDRLSIVDGVLGMDRHHNGVAGFRILLPGSLKQNLLELLHDHTCSGHLGTRRTTDRVLEKWYWPGAYGDVRVYCETCEACQRRSRPVPARKAVQVHEPVSSPFERVAMDITELPMSSKGHKFALVVMDYFTKFVRIFPMKDQRAETVADCLMQWVCDFGVPERLHTDQGRQFESSVFQTLCRRLGIQKTRTTPYHPQSDGMVERFNRTMKDMLAKCIDSDGTNWDQQTAALAMAYNSSKHASTGFSPFFLAYGREVRAPAKAMLSAAPPPITIRTFVADRERLLAQTFRRVADYTGENMEKAERVKPREAEVFNEGQRVWLTDPAAHVGGSKKLAYKYKGPYTIVQSVGGSNQPRVVWKIRSERGKEINVHSDRLKLYKVPSRTDEERPHPGESASGGVRKSQGYPRTGESIPCRDEPSAGAGLEEAWLQSARAIEAQGAAGGEGNEVGAPPPYVTRYGRVVRPPAHLQEFVL